MRVSVCVCERDVTPHPQSQPNHQSLSLHTSGVAVVSCPQAESGRISSTRPQNYRAPIPGSMDLRPQLMFIFRLNNRHKEVHYDGSLL